MEKMDLDSFRRIKQDLDFMMNGYEFLREKETNYNREKMDSMNNRIQEICKNVCEHDLSDIDFEEWRGFKLFKIENQFIDLSHTNANLNFSIIDFTIKKEQIPILKSCNIKNYEFEDNLYYPEMFDESFIEKNQCYFLNNDAPDEIKKSYYGRTLTIKEFSNNLEYFRGKNIINKFDKLALHSNSNLRLLIKLYGNDLVELFDKYKGMLDILIENNGLRLTKNRENKNRKELLRMSVIKYFSTKSNNNEESNIDKVQSLEILKQISDFVPLNELQWTGKSKFIFDKYSIDDLFSYGFTNMEELISPVIDLYKVKELMERIPEDLINLGSANAEKMVFIKRYGIDSIIRLDEETTGIFSHKISDYSSYLELFATSEAIHGDRERTESVSYEDFKNRIYEILVKSRQKRGLLKSGSFPSYDFIQGEFRAEHPDIFLKGDFSEEIKDSFYFGRLHAEDVRKNPNLIQDLLDKDLTAAFTNRDIIIENTVSEENTDFSLKKTKKLDIVEFLTKRFGNDVFLNLCFEYGKCLDDSDIHLTQDDSIDMVKEKIEESIYNSIIKESESIEHSDELPDTFKNKHPELFLPNDVEEDFRERFYLGTLTFEDIRKNPELKKILISKDTKIGFRKTGYTVDSYGRKIDGISGFWDKFSASELLDLAEMYGSYLDSVESDLIVDSHDYGKKVSVIESVIENKILNREVVFSEDVPDFFKKKHPELFLDSNAPENLRKYFDNKQQQSGLEAENSIKKENLDFYILSQHPEWNSFLVGKDLRLVFSSNYDKLFSIFDGNTLLRIGSKYPDTITKMVNANKVSVLENWYKSTGGLIIPHYIVMLYFPENEIDRFLLNSNKWSRLMDYSNCDNNDSKTIVLLKIAYSLGVFHGCDDGIILTKKIMLLLPSDAYKYFEKIDMMYDRDFCNFVKENLETIINKEKYWAYIFQLQNRFDEIKSNVISSDGVISIDNAIKYLRKKSNKKLNTFNKITVSFTNQSRYSHEEINILKELYSKGNSKEFSCITEAKSGTNGENESEDSKEKKADTLEDYSNDIIIVNQHY